MKHSYLKLLMALLLSTLLAACGGGSSDSDSADDGNSGGDTADTSGTDTGSSTGLANISSGDQAVFFPQKSSSSDVMNIGGQSIELESGSSYIYRFVPEIPALERFDQTYDATNNYSCDSAGAQKPYTSGQLLFNIEVCPDIDDGYSTVDVERVDPQTGEILSRCQNLVLSGTSQVSIEVLTLGNALYYRASGGNLMTASFNCATPSVFLAAGDSSNNGDFYAINGQLVSVGDESYSNSRYLVRLHDLTTGVISSNLLTINVGDEEIHFFEGDDALYWASYDSDTEGLDIYRYDLQSTPELLHSVTLGDSMPYANVAVDASGSKVLVSYRYVATRNSSGSATSYTSVSRVYNLDDDSVVQLDLGSGFKSYQQYMVVD